ncbi:MAG: hypothetical protein V3T43_06280 [Nitrosomonadaceae bacterium]
MKLKHGSAKQAPPAHQTTGVRLKRCNTSQSSAQISQTGLTICLNANQKPMTEIYAEKYGMGYMIANYTGDVGKFGAGYAGMEEFSKGIWNSQPITDTPFSTEEDAEKAIKSLQL